MIDFVTIVSCAANAERNKLGTNRASSVRAARIHVFTDFFFCCAIFYENRWNLFHWDDNRNFILMLKNVEGEVYLLSIKQENDR